MDPGFHYPPRDAPLTMGTTRQTVQRDLRGGPLPSLSARHELGFIPGAHAN